MNIIWVQMFGVLATFGASSFSFVAARAANRSQADVAHRTTSLTEFEKALTFQGVQLDRLRVQIMEREEAERRCQAEKIDLRRQLDEALRGH